MFQKWFNYKRKQEAGDNAQIAGRDIIFGINVNLENSGLLIFIFLLISIIALILFFKPKEEIRCNEQKCKSCDDCYYIGCFSAALNCFENIVLGKQETHKIAACRTILAGDKYYMEDNFYAAIMEYEQVEKIDIVAFRKRAIKIKVCQHVLNGEMSIRQGRVDEAVRNYEKAENLDPDVRKQMQNRINNLMNSNEYEALWRGVWRQTQSGVNGDIQGFIIFDIRQDSTIGRFEDFFIYTEGVKTQTGELYNLKFSLGGKRITGYWRNFKSKLTGEFSFELKDHETFYGKYSIGDNPKMIYSWQGRKMDITTENEKDIHSWINRYYWYENERNRKFKIDSTNIRMKFRK